MGSNLGRTYWLLKATRRLSTAFTWCGTVSPGFQICPSIPACGRWRGRGIRLLGWC
jgi:hypothetical protein